MQSAELQEIQKEWGNACTDKKKGKLSGKLDQQHEFCFFIATELRGSLLAQMV